MLSAEDIAVVKIAIEICNTYELKREILCAPGSDYDINKKSYQYDRKKQWDEIVERKAEVILEDSGLAKHLQEKVMGFALLIGMKMLTWAEYHEGILGFSREYSINFLNSSFFTQQGIIDNKKAAEELMKDENLGIKQKYKLACLYCFTDHIPALYRQMTKEDKEKFYDAERPKQPELVKFWSYYLMDEIDKLKGEKNLDQYRLEKAVESGSKAAVEYCLERTNLRRKKNAIIDAAVETVKNRIIRGPNASGTIFDNIRNDWIVFRDQRYKDSEESWIPSDYYIDILHSLLSKMRDDQKIEFLKKDIEGVNYKKNSLKDHRHSRTLEYFLNWPYQAYFTKTAELMWEFLPEKSYADLLLEICNKIESTKEENLKYGEGKSFDYRKLLKEFWCKSPEHYKRYVLSDEEIAYRDVHKKTLKEGKELLVNLFTLKNFTYEDRKNIELILVDATDKEKENIILSKEGKNICIRLMKEEKWGILDEFIQNSFPSKEQADEFKRELSFTEEVKHVCIDFIKNDKLDVAESFMKWSALPEEEVSKLKKEMIYSEDGKRACRDLVLYKEDVEVANKIFKWCFSSEEEVREFKKELIFSDVGVGGCSTLVRKDKMGLVNEFTNWCFSSQEEIKEFKKSFAHRMGDFICENLISDYSEEDIYDEQGYYTVGRTTKFKGGKWEEVEKFLTWCFSSEEEISEFKKNMLLEMSGVEIHFNLIKSNQWEEAETFFAWLGLSAEEIKELKKETLFSYDAASEMFSELMYSEEGDKRFVDYGSKQEAIELLLRWYLTDKETVLEFKSEFKDQYCGEVTEERKAMFKNFDLMIEQRLKDLEERQLQQEFDTKLAKALEEKEQQLRQAFDDKTQELNNVFTEDEEKIEVKGKSETFSPNKVLCQDINEEEKEQQSWQAFDANGISSTSDSQSIIESVQTVTVNDMLFGGINDSTPLLKPQKSEVSPDVGDELETVKVLKTLSKEERENFGFFSQNKKLCLNDLNGEQRGVKRKSETFSPNKVLCQDINEEEKEQQSWQAFDANGISSTSDSQSIIESVQTVTVNDMLFGGINDSTPLLKPQKSEVSPDVGDELETVKVLKTLSKEERENFGFFSQNKKLCLNDLNGEQRGVKRKSEAFSPSKRLCNLKLENIGAEHGK